MSRIAIAVVVLLCAASVAAAEPVTKVFPLAGQRLPRAKKDLPEVLTRTVAKALGATVASAPIEDAADLMMCKVTQVSCLRDVAKSAGAQRIVHGVVSGRAEGGVQVRLTTFGGGAPEERTYILTADGTDDQSAQLARHLTAQDDDDDEPVAPPPAPPPPRSTVEPKVPIVDDEPAAPASGGGRITSGTWALIIGGGVVAATGGGFMLSAQSLQADIARAPTNTRADFDRLRVYERAGKLRMQIGTGLAIAGGAVAVAGVVRAVLQKRDATAESSTIALAPSQGGASLFYTRGW
ncbi:MAG: hypothetical protein KF773_09925 [Deltaproteobacteria bacterium]|nr:hypothetical protein [Deltaproteobacteria bacterium]